MNRDNLVASLMQIKLLATECLNGMDGNKVIAGMSNNRSTAQSQDLAKTLPKCILDLRDAQFFKEARTAREVHEKLRSIYPCEFNRVAMALLRLKERKQLRKTSKVVGKNTQVAYVW